MQKEENITERLEMPQNKPRNKWMWWLFTIVGLFIVCLMIWMFVALSKNQLDNQQREAEEGFGNTVTDQPVKLDTLPEYGL